ncbi:flagellar protein FliT [Salirhabdus salicampi]|uniref:flagellar protein FliT n=1 Tax=Salirhabdus salicampi TaxID=476102 RepID=UPI0020C1C0B9|nr:flagellar protein FliT [Salirhabdus salicampi]MCP8617609.1 flagellar protein FliT [Salirhabdus salicampi]
MSDVQKLHELTTKLAQKVKTYQNAEAREESITEILSLLDEREALMQKLSPPYTEKEKALGQEIVKMNEQIEEQLQFFFTQLKGNLKQVQHQKRSNKKYVNPYGNTSTSDGMFFDKRN